jgi:hypothetical protein
MKKIFLGAFSVLVPYAIFVSSLEVSLKSLLVSIVCGFVLLFYIFKAGGWRAISREGKILSFPTIILIFATVFNFAFEIGLNPITLWAGYIGVTILSFIVSAKVDL